MIWDELDEALPVEGSRDFYYCKWLVGDIGRLEVGLKNRLFCC
jgi:hypothetical protein